MTKAGKSHYLSGPAPSEQPKYPVGKVAGVDSHTYNGSHQMHVLWQDEDGEWRLLCRPKKKGVYSYMGFRAAIQCHTCLTRRDKPGWYPSESRSHKRKEQSLSS